MYINYMELIYPFQVFWWEAFTNTEKTTMLGQEKKQVGLWRQPITLEDFKVLFTIQKTVDIASAIVSSFWEQQTIYVYSDNLV